MSRAVTAPSSTPSTRPIVRFRIGPPLDASHVHDRHERLTLARKVSRLGRLLPGIPRPQDLPGDLRRVGFCYWLELLHAAGEAVCDVEVAELIRGHPVRARQPARLPARRAPPIQ